jgi:hypothetical protein
MTLLYKIHHIRGSLLCCQALGMSGDCNVSLNMLAAQIQVRSFFSDYLFIISHCTLIYACIAHSLKHGPSCGASSRSFGQGVNE